MRARAPPPVGRVRRRRDTFLIEREQHSKWKFLFGGGVARGAYIERNPKCAHTTSLLFAFFLSARGLGQLFRVASD